jgi:hypothetical protein
VDEDSGELVVSQQGNYFFIVGQLLASEGGLYSMESVEDLQEVLFIENFAVAIIVR